MKPNIPLPERIRPRKLNDFFSQQHLVGKNGIINKAIKNNNIQSFILWGPPGVGKTTLANIIANTSDKPNAKFHHVVQPLLSHSILNRKKTEYQIIKIEYIHIA